MNEEQMKQLLDMFDKRLDEKLSARDEAAKKAAEEAAKKAEEEKKKQELENDKLKAAEEKVKKEKEAKAAADAEKKIYLEAFKYNSTLKQFVEDNKDFLPENLGAIIDALQTKQYTGDVEKANELKRAVIEQYIKKQENLDNLPDSLKAKAEAFAEFTTQEKLNRAAEFYDIVETGIHTAKNIKKVEAMEKGGGNPGDGSKTANQEYEEKMLQFSKEALAPGSTNNGDGK